MEFYSPNYLITKYKIWTFELYAKDNTRLKGKYYSVTPDSTLENGWLKCIFYFLYWLVWLLGVTKMQLLHLFLRDITPKAAYKWNNRTSRIVKYLVTVYCGNCYRLWRKVICFIATSTLELSVLFLFFCSFWNNSQILAENMCTEMPANITKLPNQRWILVWTARLCLCVAKPW